MEPQHGLHGWLDIPCVDFHVIWISVEAEHSSWDRALFCDALEAVLQKVTDTGIIQAMIQVRYAGASQGAIVLQRTPRREGSLQGPRNINATLMAIE